jgi:DnaJ-class molecular chaperone
MNGAEFIEYEPQECAWCMGMRMKSGENCPVCKGKGAVLVMQPARMCVACRGSAHEDTFSDQPLCAVCGGSGWRGVFMKSV